MKIISPAFENGARIPPKYTCDGDDVNPPLQLLDVPVDTKSLVIIVDDPGSPSGNWLHWSVWNIRPDIRMINEDDTPKGSVEGETDFSETRYGGPCPSYGEHEYRFMAFAMDVPLVDAPAGASRLVLEEAMTGHILASATLTGRYQRVKKEPRRSKTAVAVAA